MMFMTLVALQVVSPHRYFQQVSVSVSTGDWRWVVNLDEFKCRVVVSWIFLMIVSILMQCTECLFLFLCSEDIQFLTTKVGGLALIFLASTIGGLGDLTICFH
jgi:hypothetical protein